MTIATGIIVEIAFDSGPLDASPVWTEIGGAESVSIQRGRQDSLSQIGAGRCSIIITDPLRRYDPTNTSSPEYSTGFRIEPAKQLRVRWVYLGTSIPLFTGNVIGYYDTYDESSLIPQLRIEAVDAFGYFGTRLISGNFNSNPGSIALRIGQYLTHIGFPSTRYLWTADTIAPAPQVLTNANALETMQALAAAADATLYVDAEARVRYQPASSRRTYTNPAATFGVGAGQLPYRSVERAFDRTEIINEARITPHSGATQTVVGVTTGSYFTSPYAATLPIALDADALALAQNLVNRRQYPRRRITRLHTEQALVDEIRWSFVVYNYGINTPIRVVTSPASGAPVVGDYFIEGVSQQIVAGSQWTVSYTLTPATYYTAWTLDHPTQSILGEGTYLG